MTEASGDTHRSVELTRIGEHRFKATNRRGGVLPIGEGEDPVPEVGDRCVLLAGDGQPLAVVRTTDVRVGPLSSVDDAFAWDEGEGDRSRAYWLDAHTRFFRRQCAAQGWDFDDDVEVVFERFELVWPEPA